jgi:hypothetical protein
VAGVIKARRPWHVSHTFSMFHDHFQFHPRGVGGTAKVEQKFEPRSEESLGNLAEFTRNMYLKVPVCVHVTDLESFEGDC